MNKDKFTRAVLEPATSGLTCRCSTNWANKPYIGSLPILFGGHLNIYGNINEVTVPCIQKTVRNHDAAPLMFPLLARVVFFVRCAPGCRLGLNWRLVPGSRGTFSWNNCAGVHCEVVHIQQMSDTRLRAWMMTAEMCVRHRSMTCSFAALGWGRGCRHL